MPYRFATFDVFTDTAYAGNPLAVVYGADDLDFWRNRLRPCKVFFEMC